jgi:mannose-1-phosphate guanylyltransferase
VAETARNPLWALVLAGGDGTRLRELTAQIAGTPIPKQYCRLLGDQSLLEATLARVHLLARRQETMVIVNHDHLGMARGQVADLPQENLVIQPRNRDTGPGLLFALFHLARRQRDAVVAVFPSDHYVGDNPAFSQYVARARQLVMRRPDKVVMLGIQPDRPETGYGYILPGARLGSLAATSAAFHVSDFHEKPTMDMAASLLDRGGMWNSFVMVFRLRRMLELLQEVAPREFAEMATLQTDPRAAAAVYDRLQPWNFSTRFLARIPQHLLVLRVDDVHWSDWGTPESIERTLRALNRIPPWQHAPVASAA